MGDRRSDHTSCPIIVTAGIDATAQSRFDALREQYFPPGRTVIGAHLTLFHALPPDAYNLLHTAARQLCGATAPFSADLPGLYSLGRGVAARVESSSLAALRQQIAAPLRARLTPQDAQPFRPHITVANKLSASGAKRALAALRTEWMPQTLTVRGLLIWRYLGPSWLLEDEIRCIGAANDAGQL